jgi:hypothetical protein
VRALGTGRRLRGQGGIAHQRSDVVGQHLGGHINDQRLLAQARDGLQVQAVLEPLARSREDPREDPRVRSPISRPLRVEVMSRPLETRI